MEWDRRETHFHCRRQQRIAFLAGVSKESNKVVSCITAEYSAEVQEQALIRCPPDVHIHKLEFIQHNYWNPDELHPGCFGNILRIACFNYGIHCKHLLTLLERPMELAEQYLHVSQANTPTSASFVRTPMRNCSQCGKSVHLLNIQHCYELDKHNKPTIRLCSELCHSRQQVALYQTHILPNRAHLCVVLQTHEPTPSGKGVLLSRSNWMAQPFSELGGCRFLARWFPHRQYSNYCQRSSIQWNAVGGTEFKVLPTDTALNIFSMDSYHSASKVVVLPQAGNAWKRIGVMGVAHNLIQWFLTCTCDYNLHSQGSLPTLSEYCEASSIGVYIHFLDVVISLFMTLFEKHNTRNIDRLRIRRILHGSVCQQNLDFAISRLSALYYRCRALSVSRWHHTESRKLYFLSAVCKSWFQMLNTIIKTRHGQAMVAAQSLCSPHTKLANLSVAAIDFNKWGVPSYHGISWEVQLIKDTWGHGQMLDSDCFFRNLWGWMRFWLGHITMMPSVRSNEQLCTDMDLAIKWIHSLWTRPGVMKAQWTHPN